MKNLLKVIAVSIPMMTLTAATVVLVIYGHWVAAIPFGLAALITIPSIRL